MDRRSAQGQRHPLHAILGLVVVGTLCGCQNQDAIAQWGRLQSASFLRLLGFTRRKSPCAATLHYTFKTLDVASFEAVLREWALELDEAWVTGLRTLAIDGKTVRGSASGDVPGVHILSIYRGESRAVLHSSRVDRKTNEAKAAVSALARVDLEGAVVTGDAAFLQKEICREIREGTGDFLFVVKDNQPSLKEAIETAFTPPDSPL